MRFNPKDRALAELEEIADQNGLRVNRRTQHMRGAGKKHGWCISPNIERARPAREKEVAVLARSTSSATSVTRESAHDLFFTEVHDYDGLRDAVPARV
jgi:hypothetical protein